MIKQPSESLAAAIQKSTPAVDPDGAANLRNAVRKARGIQQDIEDLETQLSQKKSDLNVLFRDELPDLMDKIGARLIELEGEGNQPAFVAKLVPYYYANISADWPEEKRRAAFDWLEKNGHGDLIKTNVAVPFKREERKKALELVEKLRKELSLSPTVKEEVHFMTMKAWLREQIENENTLPPLELIGGDIGRVVEIKPVKRGK